ncbi:hypothetical protein Bca4012_084309 [Brassica carinata]
MPSYFVKLRPFDFNPNQIWMVAHVIDLSTYGSNEADTCLCSSLSYHSLTCQIAPIYLPSCEKHGLHLSELLFCWQPVKDNQSLEIWPSI